MKKSRKRNTVKTAKKGSTFAVIDVGGADTPWAVARVEAPPPKRKRTAPDWAPRLLKALALTGNITEACKLAKIGRLTFYRRRDIDKAFADAAADAMEVACDALEAEAKRRAYEGVEEPIFYRGQECGTIRKYSDTLLIFLLNGHRPWRFKQTHKHELSGPDGKPVQLQYEDLTDEQRVQRILAFLTLKRIERTDADGRPGLDAVCGEPAGARLPEPGG